MKKVYRMVKSSIFRWCRVLLTLALVPLCVFAQEEVSESVEIVGAEVVENGIGQIDPVLIQQNIEQMNLLDDDRELKVGDQLTLEIVEDRAKPMDLFVNDRGQVPMPYIGNVDAKGKTCRELAHDVKAELEKEFYYWATVLIAYKPEQSSRGKVNVVGEVRRPGPVGIPANEILRVSEALLRAGGGTPTADLKRVTLVRASGSVDSEDTRLVINVEEVLASGDIESDIAVEPDDTIVVETLEYAGGKISVLGEVMRPTLYTLPLDDELTVSQAILLAGGFTKFAKKNSVVLIRGGNSADAGKAIKVDVNAIQRGKQGIEDPVVKPGDIIRVEARRIGF